MFGWFNITTNSEGVPYLRTTGVAVGTDNVDFSLGFRRIQAMGYMTINIADQIPDGTTGTLPVRFVLNGNQRVLTNFGGTPVTAADITGVGVITVFYDWYSGTLTLMSPLAGA